jgi:hydrogenase maturation factor
MHDVTEGGILGAVWEMCEASDHGVEIYVDQIPVMMSTRRICEYYNINPYKLISSGCMLISTNDGEGLVKHLKASGIAAAVIGRLNGTKQKVLTSAGKTGTILPPAADELYKVLP